MNARPYVIDYWSNLVRAYLAYLMQILNLDNLADQYTSIAFKFKDQLIEMRWDASEGNLARFRVLRTSVSPNGSRDEQTLNGLADQIRKTIPTCTQAHSGLRFECSLYRTPNGSALGDEKPIELHVRTFYKD